jgi:hypothetical protein
MYPASRSFNLRNRSVSSQCTPLRYSRSASSASRLARTPRRGSPRLPPAVPSLTVSRLSRKVISWLSWRLPVPRVRRVSFQLSFIDERKRVNLGVPNPEEQLTMTASDSSPQVHRQTPVSPMASTAVDLSPRESSSPPFRVPFQTSNGENQMARADSWRGSPWER